MQAWVSAKRCKLLVLFPDHLTSMRSLTLLIARAMLTGTAVCRLVIFVQTAFPQLFVRRPLSLPSIFNSWLITPMRSLTLLTVRCMLTLVHP